MSRPPATPTRPSIQRLVLAWFGGTALVLSARSLLGVWGALGSDAPLWGLTARDLLAGAPPLVPPLYPAFLALLVGPGASPVTAGALVSAASLSLLLLTGHALARSLGASARSAVAIAISLLVIPDIPGWGFQLQPDSTAAAAGLLLALGLVRVHRPGAHRSDAALVVFVAGLAPLLREHGLVWAGVGFMGLAASGRSTRLHAFWVPVVVWCGPLLVGIAPGLHPLDVSWADRAGGALAAFVATEPGALDFLRELPRSERASYAALLSERDRFGQWMWHLQRTARLAPDGWLLIASAMFLAIRSRRWVDGRRWWVATLPLVAALPALLIWSQRRHVLLVVPVAIVVVATRAARNHRLGLLFAVVLLLHGAINWPGSVRAWQSERPRAEHYAELGQWLHAHATKGDLLGGVHQDVGLYAPALPRHDPDGSNADWRTFFISERPPPDHPAGAWSAVHRGPQLAIWQLEPSRVPRPCAGVPPPSDAPHLAIAQSQVTLTECVGLAAPVGDPSGD